MHSCSSLAVLYLLVFRMPWDGSCSSLHLLGHACPILVVCVSAAPA